ncbi:fructose-1,6-bisphosphatase [Diplocloster agilis]|uniref:Fructose-1,6-bisphosphatase class 3 n=1 Tax=Diplocloster agilis TaxID=2850323 RepID=A0A949JYH0_9FIRM|nr:MULTISPECIES: fructose-1,6-bisphosphatase [Lachnospiraceae]MBU9737540.1 fructose-1,6-bisphosphatase [Diplocloster agilis]MCU6737035.1 fructose-1,6-bisphosphatase [Suonthocola fibrivorans]SCJ95397.1 Fructose-1%2C6-bisphosphatase class 3 [uncultured Clostridium sp.]
MEKIELKYLKSIAKQYPTIASAATEIVNLQAILNLPKGTEHFVSDVHGAYEQFSHVLRNGSGAVKRKIDDEFGKTLSKRDKQSLATLIYYPEQKLELVMKQEGDEESLEDWYKVTMHRLIQIARRVSSKYTRSKVRKALPKDFVYIIEELLHEKEEVLDKEAYYNEIIQTIIRIGRAKETIVTLSNLIQRLVVDHLHVVGDIYDRGAGAVQVMDTLMNYHSVDVQWGNHDAVWMGAASGHLACIANVVRLCAKYGNLDTLEEDYGINLLPLATFALETYGEDECDCFQVTDHPGLTGVKSAKLERKMHKAITIIQLKLEGQLIKRRPEFHMESRRLLDKIDQAEGSVFIEGQTCKLKDHSFPTIHKEDPYALTPEEKMVMERLQTAFLNCDKLQKHVRFLMNNGSLYLVYNSNLLYHGCVPLNEDGSFRQVEIHGKMYSGKALYDILEQYARKGYYLRWEPESMEEKFYGQDILWFIWTNENSPVFGKEKMATFERYFLDDEKLRSEKKNNYYMLIEQEEVVNRILTEFGLSTEDSHIINGHVPVRSKRGESPVKCGGKLLIIDGGFCKAYQSQTGIAGYTLIYNSYGLRLVSHEPFKSVEDAVLNESDIFSEAVVVEYANRRRQVADTDIGRNLKDSIQDLEKLLRAYRSGLIRETGVNDV